jgi:catechol 2,3-dioxygenase-like lactoylglutathione lyase family enzyme
VLDHVGLEVTDLARSAAFYDAVLSRLGIRRVFEGEHAIAYGRHEARLWIVARGGGAHPGFGHVAVEAAGRAAVEAAHAAGGTDAGAPGPRPQYGPRYFAGYLLDPDGLKVEVVAGGH